MRQNMCQASTKSSLLVRATSATPAEPCQGWANGCETTLAGNSPLLSNASNRLTCPISLPSTSPVRLNRQKDASGTDEEKLYSFNTSWSHWFPFQPSRQHRVSACQCKYLFNGVLIMKIGMVIDSLSHFELWRTSQIGRLQPCLNIEHEDVSIAPLAGIKKSIAFLINIIERDAWKKEVVWMK